MVPDYHRKHKKEYRLRLWVFCLLFALFCSVCFTACGGQAPNTDPASSVSAGSSSSETVDTLSRTIGETVKKLTAQVSDPGLSSVGGDWLVMGVKKSGLEAPEHYYDYYYDTVRAEVKRKKGILSENRYTEYARLILACVAIGRDFKDIEGYDMSIYLDDYDKIADQGSNAAAYALIAANAGGFQLKNEDRYIELIIKEAPEALMGKEVLTDYIAMGAEALSFYADRPEAESFLNDAVSVLSEEQTDSGAMNNAESTAECIIALTQMGIDPLTDERFIKDGHTLFDGLMQFYLGDGDFYHDDTLQSADPMAAEHALLAMDALLLFQHGETLF